MALSVAEMSSRSISFSIWLMNQDPSALSSFAAAKYLDMAFCKVCLALIMSPHKNRGYWYIACQERFSNAIKLWTRPGSIFWSMSPKYALVPMSIKVSDIHWYRDTRTLLCVVEEGLSEYHPTPFLSMESTLMRFLKRSIAGLTSWSRQRPGVSCSNWYSLHNLTRCLYRTLMVPSVSMCCVWNALRIPSSVIPTMPITSTTNMSYDNETLSILYVDVTSSGFVSTYHFCPAIVNAKGSFESWKYSLNMVFSIGTDVNSAGRSNKYLASERSLLEFVKKALRWPKYN